MALIAVAADKGAPGVTTASVALAAVWPRPVLLAECDPAGGDVVYRLPAADGGRLDPRRGLLSLAVSARRGLLPEQVWEHTQKLRGGLDVLVGNANAEQGAGLDPLWGQVGAALAGVPEADVIADCGRIGAEGRHYDLLARADAVVLITRASLGDMVRLRDRATIVEAALRRRAGTASRIGVVVIADYKHFSAALAEVRQVLDRAESPVSVLGGLAFEPKSAELLSGEWGGKLDKSLLIRTAREIAATLAADLPAPQYRETQYRETQYRETQYRQTPAALPAPDLADAAAPGPAPGAAQPGLQPRRGRRGSTGPAVPAPPAAAAYSLPPPAPATLTAGSALPAMPPQPLPPARDWAQLPPAAAAPSGPAAPPAAAAPSGRAAPSGPPAAAAPPAPAPPATARLAPAPLHDPAPQHRLPQRPGGPPGADPTPAEPALAALPPAEPGWGSPQPEAYAAARQDGSGPARPAPLRQVPGDQIYGPTVVPPAGGGREPGAGAESQPGPGPAYDPPGWPRSHPSAAPGEPGRPPADADSAPLHPDPGHRPAVLRGSVLPPVPPAGHPERSAHQRPGQPEQSDWWTAPDPWAPADRGRPDRPAPGHPAGEQGSRDYGSYEHGSYEHGSYDHGPVSGGRGRHAGSRDDAQAPAADPGGR